ncbi:hypothetical protein MS3_00005643 [Schistosoma haematobium]|uniref:Uncharacterized protein n=1 Tax=Schistosoma haematobium TaxID=6185 RepID=A0A6A5D0Q2_SCHHA|nr:hypothetical protein MS3_00005643 [Schistosoma haematobium]KAH9588163.1 hypothetical protein MS3_00005643 [Schistosoma haematobium]
MIISQQLQQQQQKHAAKGSALIVELDKIDSVFNDILNSHSGSVFDDNISDSHCCGEVEGERPGITVFVEKSSQGQVKEISFPRINSNMNCVKQIVMNKISNVQPNSKINIDPRA